MVLLKVKGKYKGEVEIPDGLGGTTVAVLRELLSDASSIKRADLRLLSSGKILKDEPNTATLESWGVRPSSTIMTLVQESEEKLQRQEKRKEHCMKLVDAAGKLAKVAGVTHHDGGAHANSYGAGSPEPSSSSSSGSSTRSSFSSGSSGASYESDWGGEEGTGDAAARRRAPRLELMNQDGQAITLPPEQQKKIIEGMLLHDKGRGYMRRAAMKREGIYPTRQRGGGGGGRRRARPSQEDVAVTGTTRKESPDQGMPSPPPPPPPPEQQYQQQQDEKEGAPSMNPGVKGGAEEEGKGTAEDKEKDKENEKEGTKPGKGKATKRRPEVETESETVEELEEQALLCFVKAKECFSLTDQALVQAVDNFPLLCLDLVWLLFLRRDLSNLGMAESLLLEAERGLQRTHGKNMERLVALKGEHCAELCLYPRLNLLQGVVAFHKGDESTATVKIGLAKQECLSLSVQPSAVALLKAQAASLYGQVEDRVAIRALRASKGNLDGALGYLEQLRQRKTRQEMEVAHRDNERAMKQYGKTADGKDYVNVLLVRSLGEALGVIQGGKRGRQSDTSAAASASTSPGSGGGGGNPPLSELDVVEALRWSNNNEADAMVRLTAPAWMRGGMMEVDGPAREGAGGGGSSTDMEVDTPEEAAAVAAAAAAASDVSPTTVATEGRERRRGRRRGGDMAGAEAEEAPPTEEERALFREIEADVERDEEGHLDMTLREETLAAEMYWQLLVGNAKMLDVGRWERDIERLKQEARMKEEEEGGGGGGGGGEEG